MDPVSPSHSLRAQAIPRSWQSLTPANTRWGFMFHSFSFNLKKKKKKDYLPSEELLGDDSQSTRWFLCDTRGFP